MKRILSAMLSILMISAIFTGCVKSVPINAEPSEPEPEPIVEETMTAVIYDRGEDSKYWNAVIDAFEKENPGVTVEAYIGDDAAYVLRDRVLSADSPDFVVLPSDEETGVTTAMIRDEALTSIKSIEQVSSTLLLAGAMENVRCKPYDDKEAYLAPLFFKVSGLIVNESLLKEKKWTVPETWEDMLKLGELAKKEKISLFSYAGAEPEKLLPLFVAPLAGTAGDGAVEALFRYEQDAWNTDEVKDIAGKLEALAAFTANGSSTQDAAALTAAFMAGKVLFMPGDSDMLAELLGENDEVEQESSDSSSESSSSKPESSAPETSSSGKEGEESEPKIDIGFAAYPKLAATDEAATFIDFTEMYIPLEASNPELAKKFMIFQYSDAAGKLCAEKLGEAAPVLKAADIASQSGLEDSIVKSYKTLGKSVYAPDFAVVVGANETLSDEFYQNIVSLLKTDIKGEAFCEKMNEYVKEME